MQKYYKMEYNSRNTQWPSEDYEEDYSANNGEKDACTLTGMSVSVSCGVTAPLSWVMVNTRFCLCPPRVCFPVLYKFWQLSGGFIDDLLQEGLHHTQVCCTQSLCGRPRLTQTSTGDTQTQFFLSLCGVSGPGAHKGCLSPLGTSGRWGVWFSMLFCPCYQSCWGYTFALGCGVFFFGGI